MDAPSVEHAAGTGVRLWMLLIWGVSWWCGVLIYIESGQGGSWRVKCRRLLSAAQLSQPAPRRQGVSYATTKRYATSASALMRQQLSFDETGAFSLYLHQFFRSQRRLQAVSIFPCISLVHIYQYDAKQCAVMN